MTEVLTWKIDPSKSDDVPGDCIEVASGNSDEYETESEGSIPWLERLLLSCSPRQGSQDQGIVTGQENEDAEDFCIDLNQGELLDELFTGTCGKERSEERVKKRVQSGESEFIAPLGEEGLGEKDDMASLEDIAWHASLAA